MNNNSKALKSGIWYTLSSFLVKSIGFITTPIFARVMTKKEFGLYNNYTSWLAIITIFVTLNLESTLISARYDYEDEFDSYILSVLSLSVFSTCIWFAIFNIFGDFFVGYFNLDRIYINAILLYLLFLPAVNLFQARERYYFEYKKTVLSSMFISIGTALLSVILVCVLDDRLFGRVVGSIVPTVLLGVVLFVFFLIKGKKIKVAYWKYALPICIPFIPHLLSLNLLNSMDRVMITKWCSAEDNATYSLAYTCGSIVTLLLVSLNSAFAPWLGEKLKEELTDEILKVSRIYIYAFSFLAVGIMLVAPEVLFILGGKAYYDAKYVMTPIAMGCVCQFLYSMFVNVEQFKKKTVGMAIASVVAALVNYILNYIFIPRVGYLAAAYTTLVGYLCLLFIHMFLVYRLGYKDIYDYKLIFLVVIIGIITTALVSLLYYISIIRYIIIVVYATIFVVLIIKNKDKIISYIKKKT